jgi:hypothetical protein
MRHNFGNIGQDDELYSQECSVSYEKRYARRDRVKFREKPTQGQPSAAGLLSPCMCFTLPFPSAESAELRVVVVIILVSTETIMKPP